MQLEWQKYLLQPKPKGGEATRNTAVRKEEIPLQTWALSLYGKTKPASLFPLFSRRTEKYNFAHNEFD